MCGLSAFVMLMTAVACGDDQASVSPMPTAPPGGEPTPVASTTPNPIAVTGRSTIFGGDAGDQASALATGDFNGDGATDVILGAALANGPDNTREDGGEAYLFLGPFEPGGLREVAAGDQNLTLYGASPGDQFARATAAADLNGDGIDDIILGAPFADSPDRPDSGVIYVVSGSRILGNGTNVLDMAEDAPSSRIDGADPRDLAGFSMTAGDFNGDGIDDLIFGALWADGPDNTRPDAGEAYVIHGGSPKQRFDLAQGDQNVTVYGASAQNRMGEEVAVGDVNGDGVDDLVLPAAFAAGTTPNSDAAGQTYLILSPFPREIDTAAADQDATIYGVDNGDQLGHAVAVGDVDGDHVGDLFLGAVSSAGSDNHSNIAGEAMLFTGRRQWPADVDAAAGEYAAVVYAANAEDRLGRSAAAGDLNGDGLADLLISAPGVDVPSAGKTNCGALYVFLGGGFLSGRIELANRAADLIIEGIDGGDILGHESSGTPPVTTADMNGDGRQDILVSAAGGAGPANERPGSGEAYILFVRRQH